MTQSHRTAISTCISEFAGEHAIIPMKDKLPCLDQSASSEIKTNIDRLMAGSIILQ